MRNVFRPECNPKAFNAGDCIVGSCMICVVVVTKWDGGFWQGWRDEMCVKGFMMKPEGRRPVA